MTTAWSIDFSPTWPFLSQLNDSPPNGETPINTREDCGEACCASIVQWLTGVVIDPDDIKDVVLGGEKATGTTTAPQLRSWLSTYGAVPTTRLWPQGLVGAGSLTNLIWQYTNPGNTNAGKPLIALKRYSDTDATLHWVTMIGIDPNVCIWADSWTGTRETATYADFGKLYAGVLLGIDRSRDPFLSA